MNIFLINESFKIMEDNLFDKKLNEIYSSIPSGECDGCGSCCGESVRTHFIEFLNIYKYLKEQNKMTKELKNHILTFNFTELTEVRSCPFRLGGHCLIYPVRPLVCRLFGHLDEVEHNTGVNVIHEQNKEAAEYLEAEYSLEIPDDVIFKTIPYCHSFEPESPIGAEERIELSTAILMMDSVFFKEGILDDFHMNYGLVQWFVDLWMDEEEVDELRIQIAKEILETGMSASLKDIIEKK